MTTKLEKAVEIQKKHKELDMNHTFCPVCFEEGRKEEKEVWAQQENRLIQFYKKELRKAKEEGRKEERDRCEREIDEGGLFKIVEKQAQQDIFKEIEEKFEGDKFPSGAYYLWIRDKDWQAIKKRKGI